MFNLMKDHHKKFISLNKLKPQKKKKKKKKKNKKKKKKKIYHNP